MDGDTESRRPYKYNTQIYAPPKENIKENPYNEFSSEINEMKNMDEPEEKFNNEFENEIENEPENGSKYEINNETREEKEEMEEDKKPAVGLSFADEVKRLIEEEKRNKTKKSSDEDL